MADTKPIIKKHDSKSSLIAAITEELCIDIAESILQHGECRLLLSGGSTPGPIYHELNQQGELLNSIKLGLVDERFVPSASKFSNEKLLRDSFDSLDEDQIVGMVYDLENSQANLQEIELNYAPFVERNDLMILGMGTDGHTASIFPDDPLSDEARTDDKNFAATQAPSHPKSRITCTLKMIESAQKIFLVITGEDKWKVLMENENLPIHEVLKRRPDLIIYYA